MASVPVVDPTGKKVATRDLSADVFEAKVSGPLMHQVVVAQLAAARDADARRAKAVAGVRERAENERKRREALAEKLRALGVDPDAA